MITSERTIVDGTVHFITLDDRKRFAGHLTCGACPWAIIHTADTIDEIRDFLAAQLLAHVAEQHAETLQ